MAEENSTDRFPSPTQVWSACVMRTICYAIFSIRSGNLINESSWDDDVYCLQDSVGSRGAIAFDKNREAFFAGFFMEDSIRNPFRIDGNAYVIRIPHDLPSVIAPLKDRSCSYLLDEYELAVVPVLTCAFWGNDGVSESCEGWGGVIENGGWLLQEFLKKDMLEISKSFAFSDDELDVALKLTDAKLQGRAPGLNIVSLESLARQRGTVDISECLRQLQELDVPI